MIKKETNKWFTNADRTVFCKLVVTSEDKSDLWIEVDDSEYQEYLIKLEENKAKEDTNN